jgi:hypothetical protein
MIHFYICLKKKTILTDDAFLNSPKNIILADDAFLNSHEYNSILVDSVYLSLTTNEMHWLRRTYYVK